MASRRLSSSESGGRPPSKPHGGDPLDSKIPEARVHLELGAVHRPLHRRRRRVWRHRQRDKPRHNQGSTRRRETTPSCPRLRRRRRCRLRGIRSGCGLPLRPRPWLLGSRGKRRRLKERRGAGGGFPRPLRVWHGRGCRGHGRGSTARRGTIRARLRTASRVEGIVALPPSATLNVGRCGRSRRLWCRYGEVLEGCG